MEPTIPRTIEARAHSLINTVALAPCQTALLFRELFQFRTPSVLTSRPGEYPYMRFDGRWDNIAPVVTAQCKDRRCRFEPSTPQQASVSRP
jgi:hypothetical protein